MSSDNDVFSQEEPKTKSRNTHEQTETGGMHSKADYNTIEQTETGGMQSNPDYSIASPPHKLFSNKSSVIIKQGRNHLSQNFTTI